MNDPRRSIMHAAVAAGGVSAILMSTAVHSDREGAARAVAGESLDPLLRAVVHAIDAAEGLPDADRRGALRDVVSDYLEVTRPTLEPGRCRHCGCTEDKACTQSDDGEWDGPCGWANLSRTLCDNPDCLAADAAERKAVAA